MSDAEIKAVEEAARIQREQRQISEVMARIDAQEEKDRQTECRTMALEKRADEMERKYHELARILNPSHRGESAIPPGIGLRPGERPHA